jgi:two-component system, cell cycle sensor histidine kinase and response regulator CckA
MPGSGASPTTRTDDLLTLARSEAHLRAILESSIDAVITIDERGLILFFNPAAERLFGYAQADILGRKVNDLMPVPYAVEHDEYLANYRETGRKKIIGIGREVQAKRKDGTVFPIDLAVAEARLPDRRIFVGTIRDITDRKRHEERIREQASLLDKVHEGIMVRDLDGRVLFWNKGAESIFEWTAEETVGRLVKEFLNGDQIDHTEEIRQQALQTGEWYGELTKLTKSGRQVVVDCHWSLVRDDEGRPKEFIVLFIDITEKTQLQRRSLRAQRVESIGVLAGGIAHDLNNILTPVLMAVRLLRTDRPERERLTLLDTAHASIERGIGMLRQLLTFAGGGKGERIALEAPALVREVVTMLSHLIPKSISIEEDVATDLWRVTGDSTQLVQVLVNLCVNARDAMPDGGTLTITARNIPWTGEMMHKHPDARPGPKVSIAVADTGTGIPKEALEKIFDPFYSTKKFGEGTGLGLSTATGIVRGHGGFIDVYSEVGRGTKMIVYLPADPSSAPAFQPKVRSQAASGRGELVLVVDDEPMILATMRIMLTENGYRILTAGDGEQGLQEFRMAAGKVGAVILDMMMPKTDGATALKAIRELDVAVPVILASGLANPDRIALAKALGANGFLQKPYSDVEVLEALTTHLHKRSAGR